MYTNANAQNMVCAVDFDNDGYADGENEATACIKTSVTGFFCPLQAQACSSKPVADLDQNQCAAYGGSWGGGVPPIRDPASGEHYSNSNGDVTMWFVNEAWGLMLIHFRDRTGATTAYGSTNANVNATTIQGSDGWTYHRGSLRETQSFGGKRLLWYRSYRTKGTPTPDKCSFPDGRTSVWSSPIDGMACHHVNGSYQVSPNTCVDLDTAVPEEEHDLSGNMLTDDGARDGEGNCVDEILLFTGRAQACKKKGLSSAYQDCCKYDGEMSNVDVGSYSQTKLKLDAIHGFYSVGKAAYTAYSAASAAGATSAAAASAAGSAAGTQMAVAFDPTTLAIAAAVYLVTEWMANACSESDLDTAAANAATHCIEVGSFCSKRYKFLGCVQRKRSFCCFNGKMQRIFQEQGRPQLSTFNGFGDAKNPDCRGFTPEEFQSIDFSKIDLSDLYSDLAHNSATEVNSVMKEKTESFYEKIQ